MIKRLEHLSRLKNLLSEFPVVAIVGARQVGKTTLAREYIEHCGEEASIFDLEDPRQVAKLQEPMMVLEELRGLVLLDEIQNCPDLFPVIRVLATGHRIRNSHFLSIPCAARPPACH